MAWSKVVMPVRSAAEEERSMIAAHLPPLPTFPTPDTKELMSGERVLIQKLLMPDCRLVMCPAALGYNYFSQHNDRV